MTVLAQVAAKFVRQLEKSHWFVLSAIVFRLLLELAYSDFVSPYFGYLGLVLDIDVLKYAESWAIYLIFLLVYPKRLNKVSDFLLVYLLFAFLAPLLVFYGMANASREHLYIVLLGAMLILAFRGGKPLRIPILRGGSSMAYLLVIIGIAVVTLWMVYSGGLRFFNLDFSKVYEFRSEAGDVIEVGPMAYLITWATKVFGPVLLAMSLWKRKYSLAIGIFGLHVLWFGISSHKAVVFYPFLVAFLWVWFRNTRALALLPLGLSLIVLSAYLIFVVFSEIFVGSLLIRRVFFTPAILTFGYYEFFSQNPFVHWSNSVTSAFISYPYDVEPAKLIGRFMGTDSHANNSFLSTGYMHAGILGIVAYGIFVGLLFRVVDSLAYRGLPPWVAVASIIIPSQSLLVGADLPTAILTHGIGISVVILFLLRSTGTRRGVSTSFLARSGYNLAPSHGRGASFSESDGS